MDRQHPLYYHVYEAARIVGCGTDELQDLFAQRGDYAVVQYTESWPARRMLVPVDAVEELAAQYRAMKASFFGGARASAPEQKQEA